MNLTNNEVRMLADLERQMDSGAQPFVIYGGGRMAVMPNTMKDLGLETGQTISGEIFEAILRDQIKKCEVEIAAQEFGKGDPGQ